MVRALTSGLSNAEPNNLHRVFDAFNLALTIHAMYYYLVVHFLDIEALITVVWYVRPTFLDSRLALNRVQEFQGLPTSDPWGGTPFHRPTL